MSEDYFQAKRQDSSIDKKAE